MDIMTTSGRMHLHPHLKSKSGWLWEDLWLQIPTQKLVGLLLLVTWRLIDIHNYTGITY
jgi:hypothetical protein